MGNGGDRGLECGGDDVVVVGAGGRRHWVGRKCCFEWGLRYTRCA